MRDDCPASKARVHETYTSQSGAEICLGCRAIIVPAQPIEPKPGTQQAVILEALKQGPVCSFQFYAETGLTHRIAARILDLKALGWVIESPRCDVHSHSARAVAYTLVQSEVLAESSGSVVG